VATKKKTAGKPKVKVNRLKVKKEKVSEVTDKEAKKIRGGSLPEARGPRRYS